MGLRGGARPGAGRPYGSGKFREPTKPIRVPESAVDSIFKFINQKCLRIPVCSDRDLLQYSVALPKDTWYAGDLKPEGETICITVSEALEDGSINSGDRIIVVRKKTPQKGDRIINKHDTVFHIETAVDSSPCWGVIKYVIRSL